LHVVLLFSNRACSSIKVYKHTHTHTHRHTLGILLTRDRPVAENSTRIDKTLNKRQKAMPLAGFQSSILARKQPQTHTLDRKATGVGSLLYRHVDISHLYHLNLIKPTGYVMHQQVEYFNTCTLCPHCMYAFCICLRTNRDLCHLHKKLTVFITEMKSVYSAVRTPFKG
jgi:hypothetical protein